VLVEHSNYKRGELKSRLFEEGLKRRRCELCGQGEIWRGARMALILDHINGIADDNRLENLRVACPNCAATFETHCGRKNRLHIEPKTCAMYGEDFRPRPADAAILLAELRNSPRQPTARTKAVGAQGGATRSRGTRV
jgi:hypothetical protein